MDKRVRSMQVSVERILQLEDQIAALRECVKAADAMRFNDVGLPSWAKDEYDHARAKVTLPWE